MSVCSEKDISQYKPEFDSSIFTSAPSIFIFEWHQAQAYSGAC